MPVHYPTVERVIELNAFALTALRAKRSDAIKVLSKSKISAAIEESESFDGDLYSKAAVLLSGLVQKHPFASGNRRTAMLVTKEFLLKNGKRMRVPDSPEQAGVLQGVRENFYSLEEISQWLEHGTIRTFER